MSQVMVKPRFLSFTLTMSFRRSLMESLEKLSTEIQRVSLRSLVYSCMNFARCCRGWIRPMNQHMARSKPVKPVSTNHSICLIAREASRSEGREAWDIHVETSAAAPSTKSGYVTSWPAKGTFGAVEVRPLPVFAGLMADDVGEPPARSNLEAYGAAVPKFFLAMSGFTFDGEEVHKEV